MLKLKGSYGKVGNDDIGGQRRWVYESTIVNSSDSWYYGKNGNDGGQGIRIGEVENLNASWEEALKLNVGVEFSLFNKVKVQADYFREERTGIFLQRAGLPAIVGLSTTPYVNVGETLNQGFDGTIEYSQKIGQVFVTARGNLTYTRNKLLNNDEPDWAYKYQNRIGKPFGQEVACNLSDWLLWDYSRTRKKLIIVRNSRSVNIVLVILNIRISMVMELLTIRIR